MAMMWWGLVGGITVGALVDGWLLGVTLGFIGFIAGVIVDSKRRGKATPVVVVKKDRIAELEKRVAHLEALLKVEAAPVAVTPPPIPTPSPPPIPKPPQVEVPATSWLTSGNAIARIGIVVLFIGIAFLMKYAVEHSTLSAQLRVLGVAAGAFILLGFGWRLRNSRPGYALSLLGAGVGLLYLSVYGAFRLYNLIPASVAFPLLVAIAVFATWLAICLDSAVLAGFGAAGGFLAPLLASTGSGDHVMLFGYYAVLNIAILATAWFRSWRSLNLLGFVSTFGVATAWGYKFYDPQHFATTEPFLVFFFLLYVAVAVLFARGNRERTSRLVDGTIVFGVPLVAFSLQAALVEGIPDALAHSAMALALFYFTLAFAIRSKGKEAWTLLAESFIALGLVFATVAIPLAFDARWTSAAWALEGAAIVWVAVRQGKPVARWFGVLLQFLAGGAFVFARDELTREVALANPVFVGMVLITAAGLITHLVLRPVGGHARPAMLLWALAWWAAATWTEVDVFVPKHYELSAALGVAMVTALAFAFAYQKNPWREAAWPSLLLLPVMWVIAVRWGIDGPKHPLGGLGWLAWPLAFAVHLLARRWIEGPLGTLRGGFAHAGWPALLALLGAWEVHWQLLERGMRVSGWVSASLVVAPALVLCAMASEPLMRRWPVLAHPGTYLRSAAWPLAVALLAWSFLANAVHAGRSDPFPYIPLLTSVDLAHVAGVLALWAWLRGLRARGLERPWPFAGEGAAIVLGAAAFAWANGILLRTLHHWADVPYDLDAWRHSFLAQASLSIFWTVLAATVMVASTRKGLRKAWMAGAALMAVVVAKLAFVDFAALAGVERIASFIGVGVLMLGIGYAAPVPPRLDSARD